MKPDRTLERFQRSLIRHFATKTLGMSQGSQSPGAGTDQPCQWPHSSRAAAAPCRRQAPTWLPRAGQFGHDWVRLS